MGTLRIGLISQNNKHSSFVWLSQEESFKVFDTIIARISYIVCPFKSALVAKPHV
jgi:hypothetical protein